MIPERPRPLVEVVLVLNDGTSTTLVEGETGSTVSATGLPVLYFTDPGGNYPIPKIAGAVASKDAATGIWSITRIGWTRPAFTTAEVSAGTHNLLAAEHPARLSDETIDGLLEDERVEFTTSLGSSDGRRFRGVRTPHRPLDLPLILGGDNVPSLISGMVARAGGSALHPDEIRARVFRAFTKKVRAGVEGLLVIRRWEPLWSDTFGWVTTGMRESHLPVRVSTLRLGSSSAPGVYRYEVAAELGLVAEEEPFWSDPEVSLNVPTGSGSLSVTPTVDSGGFPGASTEKTWRRFVFTRPSTAPSGDHCGVRVYDRATGGSQVYTIHVPDSAFTASGDRVVVDTHPARRGAWRISSGGIRTNVTDAVVFGGNGLRALPDPMRVIRYYSASTHVTQMIHRPNARTMPVL